MATYYDAKSGAEVSFSYAIDALEAVESGQVVTTKGSKPAPAPRPEPKKEEAPAPEPIKEEPAEEVKEEEVAPTKKPAPRRRSAE